MTKNFYPFSTKLLSLALGLFLVIVGVQGLAQGNALSRSLQSIATFLGGSQEPAFLSITFYILEIISGAVLFLTPLGFLQPNVAGIGVLFVDLVWLGKTLLDFFIYGKPFQPNAFDWWRGLSLNVVILISIWHLRPRMER